MSDLTPLKKPFESDAQRFACYVARVAADSRLEQVIVMDVRGHCQVTDFFVIATGTSDRQLASLADEIKQLARAQQQGLFRSDAGAGSGWVVVDCIDVVAHLFTAEQRAYYDLESLWGDGRIVDWVNRTTPGQFARLGKDRSTVR